MRNSNKHWYLVGHSGGVRIFEREEFNPGLKLVRSFANPLGRVGADGAHLLGRDQATNEYEVCNKHPVRVFTHDVGTFLEQQAEQNAFASIVLVADPYFLGELRKEVGVATCSKLRDTQIMDTSSESNRLHEVPHVSSRRALQAKKISAVKGARTLAWKKPLQLMLPT